MHRLRSARCSGALEPIVDGLAQARARDRHDRDGRGACGIEGPQVREKIGGGFDEIPALREVQRHDGSIGAFDLDRAEGEKRFPGLHTMRIETQPSARSRQPSSRPQ